MKLISFFTITIIVYFLISYFSIIPNNYVNNWFYNIDNNYILTDDVEEIGSNKIYISNGIPIECSWIDKNSIKCLSSIMNNSEWNVDWKIIR